MCTSTGLSSHNSWQWSPKEEAPRELFGTSCTTWPDARKECQSQGGDLVIIRNEEDDARALAFSQSLGTSCSSYPWIGGTCGATTESCRWVDDSVQSYRPHEFSRDDPYQHLYPDGSYGGWGTWCATCRSMGVCEKAPIVVATLDVEGWTVAGVGTWVGFPNRKDESGAGYFFHPENLIRGWTNHYTSVTTSAWLCECTVANGWFAYDLGASHYISAIKLKPSVLRYNQGKEYELLLSNSAPPAAGDFDMASDRFEQVVHATPGTMDQVYSHPIGKTARFIMFHALASGNIGVDNFEVEGN